MKKALSLAVFLLALVAAWPAMALTLQDKQAGYTLELPAGWAPMNRTQLEQLAGQLVPFLSGEARQQVVANARGAERGGGGDLGVGVIMVAVPYKAMGINRDALANMVNSLEKDGQKVIDAVVGNIKSNAVRYELLKQKAHDRGYLIVQRLWIAADQPDMVINQTMSSILLKDYMVIYLGQYLGKVDQSINQEMFKAIDTIKINADQRLKR